MKGIILAGGSGSRLFPITKGISKQLLSIYDKPMIYYPLSVLMLSGIKEILIISTPHDILNYKNLLGSGSDLGLKFSYIEQRIPNGLAQAFILGKKFIGNDNVCLVLGDNIFYGNHFSKILSKSISIVEKKNKAVVFGYSVKDPHRYGIVEFNNKNEAISIEEKPSQPKSNFAVVGLYFFPNDVINISNNIKPSRRGEYEISSVNQTFLDKKRLKVEIFGRGFTWLDTGTHDSLLEASNFIKTIEKHSGYKVACLEEIAFNLGYINKKELSVLIKNMKNSLYGIYLNEIINESQ